MNIILILLIVIILILYYYKYENVDEYLEGFWGVDKNSDLNFCERAEINSMLLYIGEPTTKWFNTTRICYIIIDNIKKCFIISYKPIKGDINKYKIMANCKFDDNDELWPNNISIKISMLNGTCKIKGIEENPKIYAKLIKYHDVSNLVKATN